MFIKNGHFFLHQNVWKTWLFIQIYSLPTFTSHLSKTLLKVADRKDNQLKYNKNTKIQKSQEIL